MGLPFDHEMVGGAKPMKRLGRLGRPGRVGKGGYNVSPLTRGAHRRGHFPLLKRGRHRDRRMYSMGRSLMALSVVALLGLTVPSGLSDADAAESRMGPALEDRTVEIISEFTETTSPVSLDSEALSNSHFLTSPEREALDRVTTTVSKLSVTAQHEGVFAFLSEREAPSVTRNTNPDEFAFRYPADPPLSVTTTTGLKSAAVAQSPVSSAQAPTTTTTRPASSPPASSPPATTSGATRVAGTVAVAGAVAVAPGQSIQAAVDSHGAGTTFLIKAGVHRGQHVVPKDGDVFVGESGAVLSGEGSVQYAFSGMGADNVRIQGLVIERYVSPLQTGAIRYVSGQGSQGWVIEGNEVRSNKGIGIQAGPLWQVLGNNVHHNGQLGMSGSGGEILVRGNEIAFNNTDGNDPYWEAGGTKFVFTSQLVLRDNYVHDNKGPGLWCDINNIDVVYENNRVVNNAGPGIFHEVSYAAVIRNNVVEGNGFGFTGWIDGAGILVSDSPNVEVYGNTVRGNNDGIAAKQVSRPDAAVANHGAWELRNLWVHDNVISMNVGHSGIVSNTGNGEVYSSWGNRFDKNTYTLGGNAKYYQWGGNELSASQWKQAGQDPNGTWK